MLKWVILQLPFGINTCIDAPPISVRNSSLKTKIALNPINGFYRKISSPSKINQRKGRLKDKNDLYICH